jgi:hypothetical protein
MADKITQEDLDALSFADLIELADSAGFDVEKLRGQDEKPSRRAKLSQIILDENLERSMLPSQSEESGDKRPRPESEDEDDMSEAKRPRTGEDEEEEIDVVMDDESTDKPLLHDVLMSFDQLGDVISWLEKNGVKIKGKKTPYKIFYPILANHTELWRLREGETAPLEYLKAVETTLRMPLYKNYVKMMKKKSPVSSTMMLEDKPIPSPDVDIADVPVEQVPEAMVEAVQAPAEEEDEEMEESEDEEDEAPEESVVLEAGVDEGVEGALLGEEDIADVLNIIQEVENDEAFSRLSDVQHKILHCLGLVQ